MCSNLFWDLLWLVPIPVPEVDILLEGGINIVEVTLGFELFEDSCGDGPLVVEAFLMKTISTLSFVSLEGPAINSNFEFVCGVADFCLMFSSSWFLPSLLLDKFSRPSDCLEFILDVSDLTCFSGSFWCLVPVDVSSFFFPSLSFPFSSTSSEFWNSLKYETWICPRLISKMNRSGFQMSTQFLLLMSLLSIQFIDTFLIKMYSWRYKKRCNKTLYIS